MRAGYFSLVFLASAILCGCDNKRVGADSNDTQHNSPLLSTADHADPEPQDKLEAVDITCDAVVSVNSANQAAVWISEVTVMSAQQDYLGGRSWIELHNRGADALCLSGLAITNKRNQRLDLAERVLYPGEFLVIPTPVNSSSSSIFQLAKADRLSLFAGSKQIDTLTWTESDVRRGRSIGRLDGAQAVLFPTPGYANVPYTLFSDKKIVKVKINVDDRYYQDLLRYPLAEDWYRGELDFNGAIVGDIAVRTKGSSSLRSVAKLKRNRKSYGRYSFKVRFDRYKKQKFMGVKRLVFNNSYGDPTMMRDAIAYRLMKTVGMPASELAYVDLWFNDRHLGLYQMIEPVDGEFVEKYFPDDKMKNTKGDLYKAFSTLEWQHGQSLNDFTTGRFPQLELKTNRDASATEQQGRSLMSFLKSINSGSSELIDTDNMVRYIAAMTLIGNYDSYFANQGNYYLYHHLSVNGFTMLPWDFNLSLGRSIKEDKRCEDPGVYVDHPTIPPMAERPMIARVLERDDLRKAYHSHLRVLLKTLFNPEAMREYVATQRALMDPYVQNDPTGFYSYTAWQKSFNETVFGIADDFGKAGPLLPYVDARYHNVLRQLEGELSSGDPKGSSPCPNAI